MKTPLFMAKIITNMGLIAVPVLLEVHMMERGRVLATLALKGRTITKIIMVWRVIKEKIIEA